MNENRTNNDKKLRDKQLPFIFTLEDCHLDNLKTEAGWEPAAVNYTVKVNFLPVWCKWDQNSNGMHSARKQKYISSFSKHFLF